MAQELVQGVRDVALTIAILMCCRSGVLVVVSIQQNVGCLERDVM